MHFACEKTGGVAATARGPADVVPGAAGHPSTADTSPASPPVHPTTAGEERGVTATETTNTATPILPARFNHRTNTPTNTR